ncbi:hypothetical protein B0F90DRAFT_1399013 [Multifurca ochricompacta]|uniref:Nephrocystin 3-like N-terminal domain-containing protein n=1 Tax=Multifurca ochricompacta TaxID=376703 RepID=A0AAD4QK64_9AGAM|nr:hypothetical protein B0F90DRAFT_1399013 [Multifurca ochricompacta]
MMSRSQSRDDLRRWLSPPDPSTNHNVARGSHHDGTASWFTRGNTYKQWKMTGSLLWIHGKPGSGKSILCSTIIHEIEQLQETGAALMAYFYFDFKDIGKQDVRSLLSSILIQLSK